MKDVMYICMHKKANALHRRYITVFSLNVLNSAVKLRYKTLQNTSLAHNVHFKLSVLTKVYILGQQQWLPKEWKLNQALNHPQL
jgi:hypothetical protein